jgi:hypothetical protein
MNNQFDTADSPMDFDNLSQAFDGKNCPGLLGNPKIFFFDACRVLAANYGMFFLNNQSRVLSKLCNIKNLSAHVPRD